MPRLSIMPSHPPLTNISDGHRGPSNTLGTSHCSTSLNKYSSDSTSEARPAANQAKRKGRKGHTKSRKGCYNCKRIRIKCKENRPSCDYCAHRDLVCEWPDIQANQPGALTIRNPASPIFTSVSSIPISLQPNRPTFNMQDFRLFNHFIEVAYPHHPIGDDSVWKHEIPSISSDYDYLLHAMLALAASDLTEKHLESSQQLTCTAISYRVKAITCLNTAISSGLTTFEQGNAMLATCFALVFQSVLLDDALSEYMAFIRGTVAVGIQMGMKRMNVLFAHLFANQDLENIDPYMKAAALIDPVLVRAALGSLDKIRPLCTTELEIGVYGMLLGTARALITSSRDAYMELRKFYAAFSYHMSYPDFKEFINPANRTCQLLQSHFLALQLTMTPVTKNEWVGKDRMTKHGVTSRWFGSLHRDVPEDMMVYYEWPLWVEKEVKQDRLYNGVVKRE
ncbi:Sterol uptake control protein, partial [Lachnellula subtilissima]